MKNPNLFTRSAYTFFNSLLKVNDIVELSISNGFSNAFLIDRNIMYGAAEFYSKCIKNNIKPIIGLEVALENLNKILIAKNNDGYKELMKISSDIQLGNEFNINSDNIIALDRVIKPVLIKEANNLETLIDFNSVSGKEFNEDATHFLTK